MDSNEETEFNGLRIQGFCETDEEFEKAIEELQLDTVTVTSKSRSPLELHTFFLIGMDDDGQLHLVAQSVQETPATFRMLNRAILEAMKLSATLGQTVKDENERRRLHQDLKDFLDKT